MKKIAFIKFGGLSSGGTEVSFQSLAKALGEKYLVDFFYCDSAPYIGSEWVHPDTDVNRKKYLKNSKVNLIKFHVEAKDLRVKTHDWINTNFWDKFDVSKYSTIFSTSAGHSEYPFNKIKEIPIVNIVTVNGGVNNQENIIKTILISDTSAKIWLDQGGDKNRYKIIPPFREPIDKVSDNFREELKITDKFIYGFHQREDDSIFSQTPLNSYKRIESEDNFFLMMGGSKLYTKHANKLSLKNFAQLPSSGDAKEISKFLNTLNVFTHGRKYGETFGLVLTEAMSFGLPLISHKAETNGQKEVINNAGRVFHKSNTISYSREMRKLQRNTNYYEKKQTNALYRYNNIYSYEIIKNQYFQLLESIMF
tara:strand:+ start:3685 stop:4779 length:1095 start_codon:yes stop_codon:yes gene_type:complete